MGTIVIIFFCLKRIQSTKDILLSDRSKALSHLEPFSITPIS